MGMLDDMGRLWDASQKNARPTFSQGMAASADAAEAANAMRAAMADGQAGLNGVSANPFENMAAMNTMARGQGTVAKIDDTGQKLDTAGIYDVTMNVTSDEHPAFTVVHRQAIAAAALGNWQIGKMLPVRFDPAKPTDVMIG
jgi:hypothetical protein